MVSAAGLGTASTGDLRRRPLRNLGRPLRLRCLLSRPQINLQTGPRLLWPLGRLRGLLSRWWCPKPQPGWGPRRRRDGRGRCGGATAGAGKIGGADKAGGDGGVNIGGGGATAGAGIRKGFGGFGLDGDGRGFEWLFDGDRASVQRSHVMEQVAGPARRVPDSGLLAPAMVGRVEAAPLASPPGCFGARVGGNPAGAGTAAAGWATGSSGTRALESATPAARESRSRCAWTLAATNIANVTAPITSVAAATFPKGIRTLGSAPWCGEPTTRHLRWSRTGPPGYPRRPV